MIKKIIIIGICFLFIGTNVNGFSFPESKPVGFSGKDALYTLDGEADIFFEDSEGRITGYKEGRSYDEIPGVNLLITFGGLAPSGPNTWKQIYMPSRIDMKVTIVGRSTEEYTLMVAGGNYYTKISNIPTKKGQIDEITSTEDSVEIDFDYRKTGKYNLLFDYFGYVNTSVYESGIINGDTHKYIIDWEGLSKGSEKAVNMVGVIDDRDALRSYDFFKRIILVVILCFTLIRLYLSRIKIIDKIKQLNFFYKTKNSEEKFPYKNNIKYFLFILSTSILISFGLIYSGLINSQMSFLETLLNLTAIIYSGYTLSFYILIFGENLNGLSQVSLITLTFIFHILIDFIIVKYGLKVFKKEFKKYILLFLYALSKIGCLYFITLGL